MDTKDLIELTAGVWATYGRVIAQDLAKSAASKLSVWAWLKTQRAGSNVWDGINWHSAASRYNARVRDLHGTTTILGKTQPIPLEGIFTDVYLLDTPTAFQRYSISQLTKDPEGLDQTHLRTDGMSLVRDAGNRRLFVLGKPGAGKTTFLKHLVWQATLGQIRQRGVKRDGSDGEETKVRRTPIFISLKEWADSESLLIPFIAKQFDICGLPDATRFVEEVLEAGSAIVLFDGLDEVRQESDLRGRTIAQIRDFTNKYRKAQCVITCRIAATSYSFDKYRYVELADFTDNQIQTYARKWFQDQPEKLPQFFNEFEKDENRNLRELARTPLLLGLLCLAFDSTMTFPKRRVEIYEEAIEALLKKWDSSRAIKRDDIYRGLSLGRKRQMFARIAADTFQANEYFVPEKKLAAKVVECLVKLPDSPPVTDIDGGAVLKAIEAQHGIFCERAKDVYSFAHLTFQEYFAARFIVEDNSGRALQRITKDRSVADPRWREVALLTASLLDDATEYLKEWRRVIDQFVEGDKEVARFLEYSNSMSMHLGRGSDPAVRAFYCCLPFNLIYRDIAKESFRATIDLNLLRARSEGRVPAAQEIQDDDGPAEWIYHTRSLIQDLAAKLDLTLARTIDEALPSQVRNFTRIKGVNLIGAVTTSVPFTIPEVLDSDLNKLLSNVDRIPIHLGSQYRIMQIHLHLIHLLAHAFCYCWWEPVTLVSFQHCFQALTTRAEGVRLDALVTRLNSFSIPEKARSWLWKEFTENLQSVVLEEIKLPQIWIPTPTQCDRLVNYFRATLLFLEALEVAAVDNRDEFRRGLLMPPKTQGDLIRV
jgi:hypothetical protein